MAIARLQGIRVRPLFATVTGIAIAAAALAGTLNAVTTGVYPTLGTLTLIFAFEAVVIGGLGSLWGTLLGGILIGVTQVLVSQVSVPYATLASQLLFLLVLVVRPQGLFGSAQPPGWPRERGMMAMKRPGTPALSSPGRAARPGRRGAAVGQPVEHRGHGDHGLRRRRGGGGGPGAVPGRHQRHPADGDPVPAGRAWPRCGTCWPATPG